MEISNAEVDFKEHVDSSYSKLQFKLDNNRNILSVLSGWHYSNIERNRGELSLFSESLMSNNPYIGSIQYLKRIDYEGRSEFEQKMRESGYASFSIHDREDGNDLISSPPRSFYFPVTFIEPLEPKNSYMLGFDLSSVTELRQSIYEAIQSGEIVTSKPVSIFKKEPVFILFRAVYKGKIVPSSSIERFDQVDGLFAVMVLPTQLKLKIAESMEPNPVATTLYHNSFERGDPAGLLFHYKTPGEEGQFSWLFPEFREMIDMSNIGRPFILELSRNMTLRDISLLLPFIILMVYLSILFFIRKSLKGDLHHSIKESISKDDLFREKERAEVTLHSIADGVITTDNNQCIEYMNDVAKKLTGWGDSRSIGEKLSHVFRTYNQESGDQEFNMLDDETLERTPEGIRRGFRLRSIDGREYSIKCSMARIRNSNGDVVGSVIVFRDVSIEQAMAIQLSHQARHDELTGLYNRREFEVKLKHSLERAGLGGKSDVLCYLDLDQFKVVNDTCGHIAGDELLRQVTHLLRQNIRDSDLLARLGGDEFGLIMHSCSITKAKDIVAVLHALIREYRFVWQGKTFDIGASMGLVEITPEIGSIHDVMSAADSACYVAKDKGRNRIFAYTLNDQELLNRQGEMQWVHKIHDAYKNNLFLLYRQKVIPLADDHALCHYEVLIRMRNSRGEAVLPMAFIPAAERYNIMPDLDRWVVKRSLTMLASAPVGDRDIYNINLSGKTVNDESFLAFINEEIACSGIDPRRLCFEITETAAITNLSSARDFINNLRQRGCSFALDDFGSGLSSFAYLKNLPVDYLKIDGGFVKDMMDDMVDLAMVTCIAEVGRVMGIKTIAEFVENDAIKNQLKLIGVDYAQGYGIAMPEEWIVAETDQAVTANRS